MMKDGYNKIEHWLQSTRTGRSSLYQITLISSRHFASCLNYLTKADTPVAGRDLFVKVNIKS